MDNIGNTKHALTFAALRVHYYTGRSYLISGEGRDKVFGYRHGVMTDIGDLPVSRSYISSFSHGKENKAIGNKVLLSLNWMC